MHPAWFAFGALAFAAWTQRPKEEQASAPSPGHPPPWPPQLPDPQGQHTDPSSVWQNSPAVPTSIPPDFGYGAPHPLAAPAAPPPSEPDYPLFGSFWEPPAPASEATRRSQPVAPFEPSSIAPMSLDTDLPIPPRRTPTRRRRRRHATDSLQLSGPVAPPIAKKKPRNGLANLLVQPLPQALEAARMRFLKGPVIDIRAGQNELLFTVDPRSTSLLMVPPSYLGWPVKVTEG